MNSTAPETSKQLADVIGPGHFVDALVDYRDNEAPKQGDWEEVDKGRAYYPKNGPLVAPEELREIPEQTDETLKAASAFTTPYVGDSAAVNINTASRAVLLAAGLPTTIVDEIFQVVRAGEHYFIALKPAVVTDNPALTLSFDSATLTHLPLQVHSDTFLISATGRLTNPKVRHRIDAVVKRTGCPPATQTPCIVAWREG